MKYWLKERHNPQIGIYYVRMGKMPKKEAKKHESSLYGSNYMIPFDSEETYEAHIAQLIFDGQQVQK